MTRFDGFNDRVAEWLIAGAFGHSPTPTGGDAIGAVSYGSHPSRVRISLRSIKGEIAVDAKEMNHYGRLLSMTMDGQQTWDLSPKDVAAIKWILGVSGDLLEACELFLQCVDRGQMKQEPIDAAKEAVKKFRIEQPRALWD